MKKLSGFLCAMVLVFGVVGTANAAVYRIDVFDGTIIEEWVSGVPTYHSSQGIYSYGTESGTYSSLGDGTQTIWDFKNNEGSILHTVTFNRLSPELVYDFWTPAITWHEDFVDGNWLMQVGAYCHITKSEIIPDGSRIYINFEGSGWVVTTPIPSAIWLLGSAFIGLMGIRRKFRNT